jgi:hypothetical protein
MPNFRNSHLMVPYNARAVKHFEQRAAAVFVVHLAAYRYEPLHFLNKRRTHWRRPPS